MKNLTVKADVENAEFEFFGGAGGALDSIAFLIMEVLGPAIRAGFIREVQTRGFEAYYLNDRLLEHSIDGAFQYRAPEYNWLFSRLSPDALRSVLRETPFRVVS